MTYPPLQAQVVLPQVISSMFNTISGKKIAMFGFAFKKDTGDTRETSSMYIARELLEERCLLTIQDEQVPVASRVFEIFTSVGVGDLRTDQGRYDRSLLRPWSHTRPRCTADHLRVSL